MKKISLSLVLFLACGLLLNNISYSENLASLTDSFYGELADIIEVNMNSPKECLNQVVAYYQNNQDTVRKIQTYMEKAMKGAAPMMKQVPDKYSQETRGQLEEIKGSGSRNSGDQGGMSSSGQRYAVALNDFSQKYPTEGMKIATKAMELIPKSAMGSYTY